MLDEALQYAGRGWRVFPLHHIVNSKCSCGRSCASPGKHPRVKGGFKAATTDVAQITAWWSKWPEANIGIATGAGLTVVDLDGPEGAAQLATMVAENEPLPRTLTAQTGRGYHLYFRAEGLGSSARGKVHIRGEGGYVVAPPSNHLSGNHYKWILELPLAEMPDWLRQYASDGRQPLDPISSNGALTLGPKPAYLNENRGLAGRAQAGMRAQWSSAEEERVWSALSVIPSDSYDAWIKAGLALHSLDWDRADGTSIAFELWDDWSSTCSEKYAPAVLEEKWRTFGKANGHALSEAWIFFKAKELGWRDNSIVVEHETELHSAPHAAPMEQQARGPGGHINGAAALPDSLHRPRTTLKPALRP